MSWWRRSACDGNGDKHDPGRGRRGRRQNTVVSPGLDLDNRPRQGARSDAAPDFRFIRHDLARRHSVKAIRNRLRVWPPPSSAARSTRAVTSSSACFLHKCSMRALPEVRSVRPGTSWTTQTRPSGCCATSAVASGAIDEPGVSPASMALEHGYDEIAFPSPIIARRIGLPHITIRVDGAVCLHTTSIENDARARLRSAMQRRQRQTLEERPRWRSDGPPPA